MRTWYQKMMDHVWYLILFFLIRQDGLINKSIDTGFKFLCSRNCFKDQLAVDCDGWNGDRLAEKF